MLWNKLKKVYNRVTANSESDTDDDGYLSHRAEWHAAAWGFSIAFLAALMNEPAWLVVGIGWLFTRAGDRKVPEFVPYKDQLVNESLYVFGHAVAGIILALVVRTVFNI